MWRKGKQEPEQAGGIGEECEAFLAGRLAVYLQGKGRPIPPVGWLNQLVHATPDELEFLATGGSAEAVQPSAWCRTVAYLARSLLQRAQVTGRPIGELQRELLIPLELELIGNPSSAGLDSADVVRLTLTRLYELPELPA
jgi:hypothetical protein